MHHIYNSGAHLILENKKLLDSNPYLAAFFYLDANLLNKVDNKNYALKFYKDEKTLLVMKVDPYGNLFFGDKELASEFVSFI